MSSPNLPPVDPSRLSFSRGNHRQPQIFITQDVDSWENFATRLTPRKKLKNVATHFLFNKNRIQIHGNTPTPKANTVKFRCTCGVGICHRKDLNVNKFGRTNWFIQFRLHTAQTNNSDDSMWILDKKTDDTHVIGDRWVTHKPAFLANFIPFQSCILSHTKQIGSQSITDNELLTRFQAANPSFDFQSHTDNVTVPRHESVQRRTLITKLNLCKTAVTRHFATLDFNRNNDKYSLMSGYFKTVQHINDGVKVFIQKDSEGRFLRFFMATPASKFFGQITLPIFVVDCCHYTNPTYDGVIFNLSTTDSYGRIITLAFAVIPTESTPHLSWIVQMCWRCGIPIDLYPVFSDEGPFMSALRSIEAKWGILFLIMICNEHFKQNIYDTHKDVLVSEKVKTSPLGGNFLRGAVDGIANSGTANQFYKKLNDFLGVLANHYSGHDSINPIRSCVSVILYMLFRHPKTWTTFANTRLYKLDEEKHESHCVAMINTYNIIYYICDKIADEKVNTSDTGICKELIQRAFCRHGFSQTFRWKLTALSDRPCPRMNCSRTNISESLAATLKAAGIRECVPPDSAKMFMSIYNNQMATLSHSLNNEGENNFVSTVGLNEKLETSYQYHQQNQPQVKGTQIVKLVVQNMAWEGVVCILQKPCSSIPNDPYQCQLIWCVDDVNQQFRFTCEHPNHINKTEMRQCPCSCFPVIFPKVSQHGSFPFQNIKGMTGEYETKLYPRCYDLKSCKQIIDSDSKSLMIDIPLLGQIENSIIGYSDVPIACPPKYRVGTHGKGPRIPSKGEDKPSPRKRKKGKKEPVEPYSLNPRTPRFVDTPASNKRCQEIGNMCNEHSDEYGIVSEEGLMRVQEIVTTRNRSVYSYTNEFINSIDVVLPSNLVNGTYANKSEDSNYVPNIETEGLGYTPKSINEDLLCLSISPTSKKVHVCNQDHNLGIDSLDARDLPRMMFHNEILKDFLTKYIAKRCSSIVDAYKQAYEDLEQKYNEKSDGKHFDENTDSTPGTPNTTSSSRTTFLSQDIDNCLLTQECELHDPQHVFTLSQFEEPSNQSMLNPLIVTDFSTLTRRIELGLADKKFHSNVSIKELKAWFTVHHLRWYFNDTKKQMFQTLCIIMKYYSAIRDIVLNVNLTTASTAASGHDINATISCNIERAGNLFTKKSSSDIEFVKIHSTTSTATYDNNNPHADKNNISKCSSGTKCIFRNQYVFPMNNQCHYCPRCRQSIHGPMCLSDKKLCFTCERGTILQSGNSYSPNQANTSVNAGDIRRIYMNQPNQWNPQQSNTKTSQTSNGLSSTRKRKSTPPLVSDPSLVGVQVRKEFVIEDVFPEKKHWFNGKVDDYDSKDHSNTHRVRYEDNDVEWLSTNDIRILNKIWEEWDNENTNKWGYPIEDNESVYELAKSEFGFGHEEPIFVSPTPKKNYLKSPPRCSPTKKRVQNKFGSPRKKQSRLQSRCSYPTGNPTQTQINGSENLTQYFTEDLHEDDRLLVFPFEFPNNSHSIKIVAKNLHDLSVTVAVGDDRDSEESNNNDNASCTDSLTFGTIDEYEDNFTSRSPKIEILVRDYKRLDSGGWLNDSLVDMWMQWISKDIVYKEYVHFFSSYFFTTLVKEGVEGVKTWTEKKNINIFEKRLIFIPINENLHWTLCVVVNPGAIISSSFNDDAKNPGDLPLPCMIFFDSLTDAHSKSRIQLIVLKWLNSEWKRIKDSKTPFTISSYEIHSPKGMHF